jgi:acyl-CoA dehydrogenase family protein 9
MRYSRINLILEGTNEILRAFLALSGVKGPSEGLAELGKISNVSNALQDPIKSLGVLTDFAKNRFSKIIGSARLTLHHESFGEYAKKLSAYVASFSLAVEDSLLKYREKIIDNELPLKRISDMAVDLYVMIAVISRTTKILNDKEVPKDKKDYCTRLAKMSLKDSNSRFKKSLNEMSTNQDQLIKQLTEDISKFEGYGLDIIDY